MTATSNTNHAFDDLTNGTSYPFKVRAVNAAGAGEAAEATATAEGEEVIYEPAEDEEDYPYVTYEDYGGFPFFWVGLGTLAPLGTGTGLLIRRKLSNKRKQPK